MAKLKERNKVLLLRKKGLSYNEIRRQTGISKSTLSIWLKDMPLSHDQIQNLRGKNPQRIERFRETMRKKREAREDAVFRIVQKKYGSMNNREKIIAGLFLYWGEGTKSAPSTVAVANTDPDVLRFFMRWLNILGIKNNEVSVVLHLYKDMDYDKERIFWANYLRIPLSSFKKPYIKDSKLTDITYKSTFGHGTCNIRYFDQNLYLFIRAGLRLVRTMRL